jgi:hypothetical protein
MSAIVSPVVRTGCVHSKQLDNHLAFFLLQRFLCIVGLTL